MAKGSFGELLKREREMREVSLNEITVATRIAPRFLEALENQDWEKLPGGVFNRGFVRAIARFLGLDEENLLAEYDLARGGEKSESLVLPENRIPAPSKWLVVLAALAILLGVAVVVAAGVYGWRRYAANRPSKQSLSSSEPSQHQAPPALPSLMVDLTPISTSPAAATSFHASPLELSVSTSAATRIRVLGDGKLLLDGDLGAGENRRFSAEQAFEVTAADSSAVLLKLNGQAMPPLGAHGASSTMMLGQENLRQAPGGNSQR